jgi:hypothetical protein
LSHRGDGGRRAGGARAGAVPRQQGRHHADVRLAGDAPGAGARRRQPALATVRCGGCGSARAADGAADGVDLSLRPDARAQPVQLGGQPGGARDESVGGVAGRPGGCLYAGLCRPFSLPARLPPQDRGDCAAGGTAPPLPPPPPRGGGGGGGGGRGRWRPLRRCTTWMGRVR